MANVVVNRNPALQTSYKLVIPGLESFNYFITMTSLPGLNASGIDTPFQNQQASAPSNRIEYDPLNCDFIVAEDYANHTQLRLWMHAFQLGGDPMWSTTKNINLFIMNSNMVPALRVEFMYAYPTSLGAVSLTSDTSDNEAITSTATFRYQYYDIYSVI